MKFFLFVVLPLVIAFAIIWEGLTWGGYLMTVPNDGALFGGLLLCMAAPLLALAVVAASFTHYLAPFFKEN